MCFVMKYFTVNPMTECRVPNRKEALGLQPISCSIVSVAFIQSFKAASIQVKSRSCIRILNVSCGVNLSRI